LIFLAEINLRKDGSLRAAKSLCLRAYLSFPFGQGKPTSCLTVHLISSAVSTSPTLSDNPKVLRRRESAHIVGRWDCMLTNEHPSKSLRAVTQPRTEHLAMTDIDNPRRHAACDECREFIESHWRSLKVLMLDERKAEAQMSWTIHGMYPMYQTELDMPLLRPETDGSSTKETKTLR